MASKIELGELYWKITGETSDFVTNLGKAQAKLNKFSASAKAVGGGMTKFLTLPLAALGAVAIKNASDFETQRVAFGTLLKDVEKGNQLFETLRDFSAETPLALGDITKTSERLLAVGVGVEKQVEVIRLLGDLSLGNAGKLDTLTNAYSKLRVKGRASLEEINMFSEAGIPLLDQLSKNLGVSSEEVFKLISSGSVGFDDVEKALQTLTGETGAFNNALKNASETTAGKFSTAMDNLKIAAADLGNAMLPTVNKVIDGVTKLAKSFTELPDGVKEAIVVAGVIAAALGPIILGVGQLTTAISALMPVVVAVTGALSAVSLPLVAVAALALGGAAAIGVMAHRWATTDLTVKNLNESLQISNKQLQLNSKAGRYFSQEQDNLNENVSEAIGLADQYSSSTRSQTRALRDTASEARNAVKALEDLNNETYSYLELIKRPESVEDYNEEIKKGEAWAIKLADKIKELQKVLKEAEKTANGMDDPYALDLFGTKDEAINTKLRIEELGKLLQKQTETTAKLKKEKAELIRIEKEVADEKTIDFWNRYNKEIDNATAINKLLGKETDTVNDKIEITEDFLKKVIEEGLNPAGASAQKLQKILRGLKGDIEGISKGEAAEKLASNMQSVTNIALDLAQAGADLVNGIYDRQIDNIDRVKEAQLLALEEYSLAQKEAIMANGLSAEEQAAQIDLLNEQTAANQSKLEKKRAKEKAELEYKGAMVGWGMQLAMATAQAPIAVLNAYAAGSKFGLITAGIFAGIASVTAALQVASVAASKPQRPSFAVGTTDVPHDMVANIHKDEMIVPATFADGIRKGEVSLGAGGGGGHSPVYLDGDLVGKWIYNAQKDGRLNTAQVSIV